MFMESRFTIPFLILSEVCVSDLSDSSRPAGFLKSRRSIFKPVLLLVPAFQNSDS